MKDDATRPERDVIDGYAKTLWVYNLMHHKLVKSDAIIAMGSMDLRVAERAADLWRKNLAKVVVVAGGHGRLTAHDWVESEAQKFRQVLVDKGVPDGNILVEGESTNSEENLRFSVELLLANRIDLKRVIVVTKPYMERRAFATWRNLYPNIDVLMASPVIAYERYPNAQISKDLMINILVGDTQRVKVYAEKGFSIAQDMPNKVSDALEKLILAGYTEHLVN